jgi:lipoyl(octanoyl) transferase
LPGAYLYNLGVIPYREALALQQNLAAARRQEAIPDVLVLLEHPPTITLGSRTVEADELPLGREPLLARGIEIVEVARGGRSTYHGPGQLVAYPIVDLRARRADLHRYVRALERATVVALADLGVEARTRDAGAYTGAWVGDRKIASVGVYCKRWVTMHGLAVNVDTDLTVHGLFDACGLGAEFTSVAAETGSAVTTAEARGPLAARLAEELDLALDELPVTV